MSRVIGLDGNSRQRSWCWRLAAGDGSLLLVGLCENLWTRCLVRLEEGVHKLRWYLRERCVAETWEDLDLGRYKSSTKGRKSQVGCVRYGRSTVRVLAAEFCSRPKTTGKGGSVEAGWRKERENRERRCNHDGATGGRLGGGGCCFVR